MNRISGPGVPRHGGRKGPSPYAATPSRSRAAGPGMAGPAGLYNLADDLPGPQNAVIAHGSDLLGVALPPLQTLEEAPLSPAAAAFYGENRRIANGKAKRLLGWTPRYADYRSGLAACLAEARMQRDDHAAERERDA